MNTTLQIKRVSPRRKLAGSVAAALLLMALPIVFETALPQALATHNRGTQLTWTTGSAPGDVNFVITFSARRSYYGSPVVGGTITDPRLDFGDGATTTPTLRVIAIDSTADIVFAEAAVPHHYDPTDLRSHTASLSGCCRISASSGHINNPDGSFRVTALVNLAAPSSPSSSISPIVDCPVESTCSFPVPASSNGSYVRSWRLATAVEASGSTGGFQQPPQSSIDSFSGVYKWDTRAVQISTVADQTFYSTQVIIEYYDARTLALVSSAATDFLLRVGSATQGIPDCVDVDGNGSVDNDSDGLCDNWESQGIDSNGDGVAELRLYDDNGDGTISAGEGADLNKKDVYVEIDYMTGATPSRVALDQVRQAFATAPGGIRLHLLTDEAVAASNATAWASCTQVACPSGVSGFDDIKRSAFGRPSERATANAQPLLAAKRYAFHYSLFASGQLYNQPAGVRGIAEIIGNDLMVFPSQMTGSRQVQQVATTFMHELGHNLGLGHGGAPSDAVNCKPNYLSIMNYIFSDVGYVATRPMDYSRGGQQLLDESSLSEPDGVFGPYHGYTVTVFGDRNGDYRRADLGKPIDWNASGGLFPIDSGRVSADINRLPARAGSCAGAGTMLQPHDDWANLQFAFYSDAEFAFDVHFTPPDLDAAITTDAYRAVSPDTDSDGLLDVDDNCALVANADQADQDQDGFGDRCDGDAPPPVAAPKLDVLPGTADNAINLRRRGVVPVALLSSSSFDATKVDYRLLCFGDAEAPSQRDCSESDGHRHSEDVNGDGRPDLLLHYDTQQTGIDDADTRACLSGRLPNNSTFESCDNIRVVG